MKEFMVLFALTTALGAALGQTPTPSAWAQEPTAFAGVPFDATIEETATRVRASHRAWGPCVPEVHGRMCEGGSRQLGHSSAEDFFQFTKDGRLVEGVIRFDTNDFFDVKETFIERFGRPSETRTVKVIADGAEIDNEILLWRGSAVTIELRRWFRLFKPGEQMLHAKGAGIISTNAYRAALEAEAKKTAF